jgi:hypothetical protein
MDLTMTVVSYPNALKKPEHSRAMYEAPTTSVFPGAFLREKISSEVIPNSLSPGIPGYDGLPPVAITILSAVTCETLPFPSSR